MESLVGTKLVDAKGKEHALADVIKPGTKAVGLYFSAHWCPPCRGFTPMLAQAYTNDLKAKGLEIIFVSSDKDENAFKGYLGEMPWYALPFGDRDRKGKLSSKFKIEGIPSLVILEPDGTLITDGGRAAVMQDRKGENFPWRPRNPADMLKEGSFSTNDGKKAPFAEIAQKVDVLGLYFSASWCGPCHRFTPILAECYKTLKAADEAAKRSQRFEVIFLSGDRDSGSFTKYFASMPWLALDFSQTELKSSIEERFQVEGIPTLVLIDPKTGAVLNVDTVGAVMADPKGEDFPWTPKSVELLSPATAQNIGPTPALFVFCGSDEAAKKLRPDLQAAVDVWQGKSEEGAVCHGDICIPTGPKLAGSEDMLFFVCGDNPVVSRVKELAKAREGVVMAILNLAGNPAKYAHSDVLSLEKVTPLSVRKFVANYLEGKVATANVEA